MSIDIKPHAYDPATNPELFEGVLARRVVAFLESLISVSLNGVPHVRIRARGGRTLIAACCISISD